MSPEALKTALAPICATIAGLDLSAPAAVVAALNAAHPLAGLTGLRASLEQARDEGWLAPRRGSPTLTFGRLAKATPETHGLSIDVVDMEGVGAEHVHPKGEVSLCFATAGDPRFMGFPEGWVVVPPGNRHIPTVSGGKMLIVYFLPDGAITFQ